MNTETPEVQNIPPQPRGQLEKSTSAVCRAILKELAVLPIDERSALLAGTFVFCQDRHKAMMATMSPILQPSASPLIIPGRA